MSTIKVRARQADGITQVRILITHPMHNGRLRDPETGTIPAPLYIERLRIEHGTRLVADCRLSTSVSRDPYLAFRFRGGAPGDRIRVSWTDNHGHTDQSDAEIR